MEHLVALVAVVVVGVMVGVEFAVAFFVNPIMNAMPGTSGLAARSHGARLLGRVMPFWYIGSMVLAIAWAVLAGGASAVAATTAAGLLVLSVLVSVTLLVPINNRAAAWGSGDAPADWRKQLGRWDRLHYGRVALIVAAFALLAWALGR